MSTPIEFDGTVTKNHIEDLKSAAIDIDALVRELVTAPNRAALHNKVVALREKNQRIIAHANALQRNRERSQRRRLKQRARSTANK